MHTLLCRRCLGSGLVEVRHRAVERAGRVRLCRIRTLLTLTVPELCRGGPGKRCGKRRKWLIYNKIPRLFQATNQGVVGSIPASRTRKDEG